MIKEKILFTAEYKKGDAPLRSDSLPVFPAQQGEFKCVEAYLMKIGKVKREGKEMEFQEVRVYLEPSTEQTQFEKDIRQDQKEKCIRSIKKGVTSKYILPSIIKSIMES